MKAIIGYIGNFWKLITTIVGIIIDFATHIIDIIGYVAKVNDLLLDLIDTAPVYIKYFCVISLLISILYLFLGRAGGKS